MLGYHLNGAVLEVHEPSPSARSSRASARARAPRQGRRARAVQAQPARRERSRSTPAAASCRGGTPSARPGLPISPRSPGSCAGARLRGRLPGTGSGWWKPWVGGAAGMDGSACVVTILSADRWPLPLRRGRPSLPFVANEFRYAWRCCPPAHPDRQVSSARTSCRSRHPRLGEVQSV